MFYLSHEREGGKGCWKPGSQLRLRNETRKNDPWSADLAHINTLGARRRPRKISPAARLSRNEEIGRLPGAWLVRRVPFLVEKSHVGKK